MKAEDKIKILILDDEKQFTEELRASSTTPIISP